MGRAVVILIALFVVPAPALAQSTWTTLASGTMQDITAVEHNGPGELWYATAGGQVARRVLDGFDVFELPGSPAVHDIAFAPNGAIGLAGADGGDLFRTSDGGDTWAKLDAVEALGWAFPGSCKDTGQLGPIRHVTFARDGATAFAFADAAEVLQSDATGAAWSRVNPIQLDMSCKVPTQVPDSAFLPGDAGQGWLAGETTYKTTNALATVSPQLVDACSGTGCRLELDPAQSLRQWALRGGYVYLTDNAWTSGEPVYLDAGPDSFRPDRLLRDMAFAGGTLVAVGDGGNIDVATDGRTLTHTAPPEAAEEVGLAAVDGYDATHFAAGGAAGVLLVTDRAATVPSTAPPPPPATTQPPAPAPPAVAPPAVAPPAVAPQARGTTALRFARRSPTARVRRGRVVVTLRGTLVVPAGTSCAGAKVEVAVMARTRRRARRTVIVPRTCSFTATLRVRPSLLRRSATVRLRFAGSPALAPATARRTVIVKALATGPPAAGRRSR